MAHKVKNIYLYGSNSLLTVAGRPSPFYLCDLIYQYTVPLSTSVPLAGHILNLRIFAFAIFCVEHSLLNTCMAPLPYFLHTFPSVFPSRRGFSWALYLKLPFRPLFTCSYPLLLLFSLGLLPSDFLCVLLIFCISPVNCNLSEC